MNRHDARAAPLLVALALALLTLAAATPLAPLATTAAAQAPATAPEEAPEDLAGEAPEGVRVRVDLSLDEAIRRALESNEAVLLAEAERRRSEGQTSEATAALWPDLSFDLDYTRNIEQPVFFLRQGGEVQEIQVGSDNEYDLALSLNQPLYDARLLPAKRAAESLQAAAAAGVVDSRTAVVLTTRLAYYDVLLARADVEVQRQALAQAGDRLSQVEEFFSAGTAAEFDVLTAEVEVDNIRPDLIEAEGRLELSTERLKRIVGLPPSAEVTASGDFTEVAPVPPLAEALEAAYAKRADLRTLELEMEAQEERVSIEERSWLPQLDLVSEMRRQASTDDAVPDDLVQSSNARLSLTFPFFQGGARRARVAQQEALLDSTRLRVRQLSEDIRVEVQQVLVALRSARQAIGASQSNVDRAERALEIAQVRFSNGLSTQVELNDAELAVTRARSNYAAARYGYSVAWARLQAAVGESTGP